MRFPRSTRRSQLDLQVAGGSVTRRFPAKFEIFRYEEFPMSTGLSDSSSEKSTTDTRVVRLRRRLGSLPEVVSKFGPPPEEPKGRPRSDTQPSLNKAPDVQPGTQKMLDKAKERQEKQTEVGQFIGSLGRYVDVYEKQLGDKANPSYRGKHAECVQSLERIKKITDDTLALQEIATLNGKQKATAKEVDDALRIHMSRSSAKAIQDKNTVPEYQGRALLKDTGAKEFKRSVTDPVAQLMNTVNGEIQSTNLISEETHTKLVGLVQSLRKKGEEYSTKAEGIDKDKHPNMRTLYDDYTKKCKSLASDLHSLALQNVPTEIGTYRDKKRSLDAAFLQLAKTTELWKRIDKDTYDLYADVGRQLRDEYGSIDMQLAQDKDLSAAVSAVVDLQKRVEEQTRKMFESQESNDKLDKAVEKLGSEAKTKEDRAFVQEAMKARFNLTSYSGDLTKTNVIAMYNIFNMVPDSHTKTNKWLTHLTRDMSLESIESFYLAPDKSEGKPPQGLVAIKAMRTSGPLTVLQNDIIGQFLLEGVKGSKRLDQFTWVTLHEIGHAVDQSEDFMDSNLATYGDWKKRTSSDVEKMMVEQLRKELPNIPRTFAAKYIATLMAGKNPEEVVEVAGEWTSAKQEIGIDKDTVANSPAVINAEQIRLQFEADKWPDKTTDTINALYNTKLGKVTEPEKRLIFRAVGLIINERLPAADAVKQVMEGLGDAKKMGDKPDWKALKNAKILAWYKSAKLKEPKNAVLSAVKMLSGNDGWVRAGKYEIDGYYWHEAYEGDWWSYKPDLWKGRVSNYQMRAPGEYFAEAYAAFYLHKLPKDALLYDALKALDQKTELKN
jgi:hypothetical protein